VSADIHETSPGEEQLVRISSAKTPPRKNEASTENRYITPIRL
jgi:hypothetical protein